MSARDWCPTEAENYFDARRCSDQMLCGMCQALRENWKIYTLIALCQSLLTLAIIVLIIAIGRMT